MKENLIKTNIPGFIKNKKTNVIINTDNTKFDLIKAGRESYKQQRNFELRIKDLEERVNRLEKLRQ